MRYLLAIGLTAASLLFTGLSTNAEEAVVGVETPSVPQGQVVTVDLIAAHREYQLAKLRMHEYRFVTLPRQRRFLDDQMEATRAEIALLHRRLRDYRPFLQVGQYSPVRTAAESHHLALIAAKQRLRQLEDERIAQLRLGRQQKEIYRLEVLQAAVRMALARKAVSAVE